MRRQFFASTFFFTIHPTPNVGMCTYAFRPQKKKSIIIFRIKPIKRDYQNNNNYYYVHFHGVPNCS